MASADKLIAVFTEAKARPVGPERDRFLAGACGEDAELKEQVVSLLEADREEGRTHFLKQTPLIGQTALVTEKPGDRIGRYKLLQQLGEGGCGVVYVAEQEEPVRRRVALKVIKLGMDTRSVIARFEAERQALALMDHPNIAKVFDAGATETGRPYFVMELVRGIKITDYCDQNNLTTGQRLELFTPVCHAVQHAHQKGIIHRDLKPSNILVTLHDGVPVPKVIDFGIAKATTDQRLTDKTVFTAFEQFIGTPAYMSPEQAEMSGLDIDTRSDVYSLGVLLYELLTGRTPLDPEELLRSGMNEMRRKIREDEPPRPSTRLSTMQAADLSTIAKHRQADAPKLIHLVRGDLDWIVMKCLEKDRTRRYETANGLAMDLQRHLSNEPVVARPPSTAYRTLKFIRRHRVGVAMAGVVTLVLMVGLVVSLAGFAQARRERDRAQAAQAETLKQKLRADQSAAESHRRLVLQYLADGNRSVDAGDLLSALPWFGRALEEEQADPLRTEMHRLRLATIIQQSPKLVALCFHSKTMNFAEFSRDGSRFVTAGAEGTARVWNAVTGEAVTPWLQHTGAVLMARFSPDGLWVATASQDGTAQIWNATTGEPRVPPLRHKKGVRSVAFSPDGLWLLTGSEDTTAQVWDAATGRQRGAPLQQPRLIRSAEFSPDGNRILSADPGGVRLWNLSPDGAATLAFQWSGDFPVFSPDGQRVGLIYAGSSLRVFDPATGKQIVSVKIGAETRRVMFSPDGVKIVTVGETSQIWDAATGAPITAPLRPSMLTLAGSFSPNGRWVMTAGADKAVRLWDPASGDSVAAPLTHAATVRTATFSPDGRRILTGCDDGTVRLWDLAGGESASLPVKHESLVYKIAFHPDSQRVLTVGLDGTAVFWELATGGRIESILTNLNSVSAADFSADGQRVAIGYRNGTVQVWNLISGAPVGLPFQHQGPIQHLEFSPGGLHLVTASDDSFACVWDLPSGNLVARMKHTGPLSYATFTSDGKKVVTTTDNSFEGLIEDISKPVLTTYRGTTTRPPQAQVWDATTGAAIGPPFKIEGSVSRVDFSPDRRYLVTACSDPTASARLSQVFVWDVALAKQIPMPLSHPGTIVDACFSSDSKRVVTSGAEGTVRIWDAATGKRLTAPLSSAGAGRATFSPDNHLVITAGFARGARLWDANTGEPVSTPIKPKGAVAVNLAMFSPDGRYAVLATGDGYAQAWRIPRSNHSWEDELHYAQMLAGGRVDEQEALSLLTPAQIKTTWEELRAKYPGDSTPAPEQVLAWRQKYAADNTRRAQEHIRLGQLAEARVLISKIRLADSLPAVAAVLDDLVNLREIIDHGSDSGNLRQIATETLRIPVDDLTKGKAPWPVTRQAEYLRSQGKLLEAEKLFEDVIALERKTFGDASVSVAATLHVYADFVINRENKPGAAVETLYREELVIWGKLNRVGGVEYTTALRALLDMLESENRPAEIESLYHEVLTAQRAALGNSPVVAETLISLADILQSHEKPAEAEQAFREGMDIILKLSNQELARLRTVVRQLAQPLRSQAKSRNTGRLYEESIQVARQRFGETSQVLGDLLSDYAGFLESQNKFEAAAECHLKSLPIRRAKPNDNLAATLRQLGGCLIQTGKPREAEVYLRESLALYRKLHQQEDLYGTAWATDRLANALWLQHRLPEAEQTYRDALLACSKCQALDSLVYAGAVRILLDILRAESKPAEIEALCREVLAGQRAASSNDSPVVAETLIRLAGTLQAEGKLVEAEPTLREGMDLIFKLPDQDLISLQWGIPRLAEVFHAQGKSLEAEQLYEKLIALQRKTTGDANPALGATLSRYGDLLSYWEKKPGAAVKLYLEALRIFRGPPPNGGQIIWTMLGLGDALQASGNVQEAEPYHREALAISRKLHPQGDEQTARALDSLARNLMAQKRLSEAQPLLREEMGIWEKLKGVGSTEHDGRFYDLVNLLGAENKTDEIENLYRDVLSRQTQASSNGLATIAGMACEFGDILVNQKKPDEAARFYRQALDTLPKISAEDLLKRTSVVYRLARALHSQGRDKDAEKLYEDVIASARKTSGESSVVLGELLHSYGEFLRLQANKFDAAAEQYLKALAIRRATPDGNLAFTLCVLGHALVAAGKPMDAEPYFQESLTLGRKLGRLDNGATVWSLRGLATIRTAQKRFPEAEPLYQEELSVWEKLKGVGSDEYADTLRALVQLYEATGQSEKVAEWNKKLAEFDQAAAEKKTTAPKP